MSGEEFQDGFHLGPPSGKGAWKAQQERVWQEVQCRMLCVRSWWAVDERSLRICFGGTHPAPATWAESLPLCLDRLCLLGVVGQRGAGGWNAASPGAWAARRLTSHRLPRDPRAPDASGRHTRAAAGGRGAIGWSAGGPWAGLQKLFRDWLGGTKRGLTQNVGVAPPEACFQNPLSLSYRLANYSSICQ